MNVFSCYVKNATMNKGKIITLFVLLMFFLGCMKDVKKDIILMKSVPFELNIDDLTCVKLSHDTIKNTESRELLKIVVFSDSTVCSPCEIKALTAWNHYMQLVQRSEGKLQLYFIFASNKKDAKSLLYTLKEYFIDYPVYIDTRGVFQQNNPHLSKNRLLHTFLLDENNNVILVGNPVRNLRVKDLYDKAIVQKIPISDNNM